MAPCYRNIASKPLELLEHPNAYMPIWRRKSETSRRMDHVERLKSVNNGQSAAERKQVQRLRNLKVRFCTGHRLGEDIVSTSSES